MEVKYSCKVINLTQEIPTNATKVLPKIYAY